MYKVQIRNSQMKHTVHSKKWNRDLVEFTKEEIIAMCPKDVVEIRMPKKDDRDRLMGPPSSN